jgi:hypothetical protein
VTQTCGLRKIKRAAGVISGLGTTAKTPDQKQRHAIGRARRGDMPALSKIAKEGIQSAADFLKSFSDKVYYHGSNAPDIKKFDSGKEPTQGGVDNTGATYFTTDEDYAHEYALREFIDNNFYRQINDPIGNIRDYVVKGPMAKSDAARIYQGTNFTDLTEYGRAPTVYPVKIKTSNLFDFENTEHIDDLISDLSSGSDLIGDVTMGSEMSPKQARQIFSSQKKKWGDMTPEEQELHVRARDIVDQQPNEAYAPSERMLDDVIYEIREGNWEVLEDQSIQKILKDKGYRGYRTNEPGTVGLFYPDQGDVRSINAKFDPAKAKSGNILASVPAAAAAGISGYGALDMLGEER